MDDDIAAVPAEDLVLLDLPERSEEERKQNESNNEEDTDMGVIN